MDSLTILKLGGSVVTKKDKPFTPDLEAIDRLAIEIAKAGVKPLIIIHGGGSFGHPVAEEYKLKEGYRRASQILGFTKTRQAMTTLNGYIIDALIRYRIPAVAVQPSACTITKEGRIFHIDVKPMLMMLKTGFVPVMYGDAVPDLTLGFTILSGDQLIANLASALSAKRVIVGVDVDGLYTADPKLDPNAQLIVSLNFEELNRVKLAMSGSTSLDVTGGMLGKVTELMSVVKRGVEVIIVNASMPNRVYQALLNEDVVGTTLRFR
ncbi:isopentenyl phosphate kinase family protein [Candidatus Bathyarchaeota archaeon]|nr:isopentenyl phosphate kinase family protein [Candidatus Bathyarchaeota archaeon]